MIADHVCKFGAAAKFRFQGPQVKPHSPEIMSDDFMIQFLKAAGLFQFDAPLFDLFAYALNGREFRYFGPVRIVDKNVAGIGSQK